MPSYDIKQFGAQYRRQLTEGVFAISINIGADNDTNAHFHHYPTMAALIAAISRSHVTPYRVISSEDDLWTKGPTLLEAKAEQRQMTFVVYKDNGEIYYFFSESDYQDAVKALVDQGLATRAELTPSTPPRELDPAGQQRLLAMGMMPL